MTNVTFESCLFNIYLKSNPIFGPVHTVPILDFSSLLFYLNLMKNWNPVAYSVSIYGSLYCFTSFLYLQGVSFFLFVRLLFQKKSDDLDFIGSRTLSRSPLAPSSSS